MAELKENTYKLMREVLLRVPGHEGPPPRLNLVCDPTTLTIIGSVCKMSDLYDLGITSVENVLLTRQPLPSLDAFYFISPSRASIDALMRDYDEGKKPQHDNVHLIFCDEVQKDDFDKMAQHKGLAPRVKSFREAGINFCMFKEDCFHLNQPDILRYFDGGSEVNNVSRAIMHICDVLKVRPAIRYSKAGICPKVATQINAMSQASPLQTKKKMTLLIVDRSIDVPVSLMHMPFYEALVYDLMPEADKDTGVITVDGKSRMLHDTLFETLKYLHFIEVRMQVQKHTSSFLKQHQNIAALQAGNGGGMESKDMMAAIRDVPEYQEQFGQIDANLTLSKKVLDALQDINIIVPKTDNGSFVVNAGSLESELATGVTDNEKEAKLEPTTKAITDLFQKQPNLKREVKLRLVLLFVALFHSCPESSTREIMDAANLPPEDRSAINKFIELKLAGDDSNKEKYRGDLRRSKSQVKLATHDLKKQSQVIERYTPRIKTVLERLVDNKLETEVFPGFGVEEITNDSSIAGAPERQWGWKLVKTDNNDEKPLILVFFIGGVTFGEIRAANQLKKAQSKCDILVGGTCILTPHMMLESLRGNTRRNSMVRTTVPDDIDVGDMGGVTEDATAADEIP